MRKFFGLTAIALSIPAAAQTVTQETPKGVNLSSGIGDVIWEQTAFNGVPGVVISGPVRANWGSAEVVNLPSGSGLMIIRDKKLKACRERTSLTISGMTILGWSDCLIDKDEDGKFELVSFNEVGGTKPISPPVAYLRETVPTVGVNEHSFKKTLTYLGKSGNDLKLSYREYSNDLARPAFTEELSLPLNPSFPQKFRVKGITFVINSIDGEGLGYMVN